MDIDCPEWLEFFHGGLRFQTVRRLFPRMPRHNFRKAHKLIVEFCEEIAIPYALYGFVGANGKVIGRLEEIVRQARILAECQRSFATQDVLDSH